MFDISFITAFCKKRIYISDHNSFSHKHNYYYFAMYVPKTVMTIDNRKKEGGGGELKGNYVGRAKVRISSIAVGSRVE